MYNKFIFAWFSLFHCENDLPVDASTKVSKQKDQYTKLTSPQTTGFDSYHHGLSFPFAK